MNRSIYLFVMGHCFWDWHNVLLFLICTQSENARRVSIRESFHPTFYSHTHTHTHLYPVQLSFRTLYIYYIFPVEYKHLLQTLHAIYFLLHCCIFWFNLYCCTKRVEVKGESLFLLPLVLLVVIFQQCNVLYIEPTLTNYHTSLEYNMTWLVRWWKPIMVTYKIM